MNGIEAVARILKLESVEWLACYPSNPLIEAAAREGIRPIAFRHERGAIMAADGYSRTSDRQRFGVVAVQSQAGAENSLGGIAQAFADNVPILVLPGGVPLHQIAVRPNFSAVHNYGGLARRVEAIYAAEQIPAVMRRAFHALRNGPPGPVVVELTADVLSREAPESAIDYTPPPLVRQAPEPDAIAEAASLLLEAERPLVWSGGGVLFARATAQLRELAELLDAPVFTTMPGKSSFDERHPLSIGAGAGTTTLAAHKRIGEADVLLALGTSLTRTGYGQSIRPGTRIIHNTASLEDLNKDETAEVALPGDAALVIEALIEELRERLGEDGRGREEGVAASIAADRDEWLGEWEALLESDEVPVNTYRVIREIDRTIDRERSIVTHDAGAPRDSIVPFFTATTPHSYVGWGKTTHLGFSIPLMIGAKLAHPDRFCLNLMGDGAFGMSGMDIETSARAGVPITTVVLNNGGMATYPGGFPTAREQYGVSHMTGNYAQIAEGMGAVGIEVLEPSELAPAIERAQQLNAEGRTVLIDVHSNMEARRSRWDR
ncbi:MAG: thiamine pyrophosphate-requiring protein [Chloroflexota bacterium]|nr:thiamine pyrophosphate-requiring protein [Chloroflexota bacterium]